MVNVERSKVKKKKTLSSHKGTKITEGLFFGCFGENEKIVLEGVKSENF
jgi:hypothetical protein